MKLALFGAAGSGKTDIAKRLTRGLNRDGEGHWVVIDGYVDRLTERTGCLYGESGDYEHNLQVMVERWTLEAEAIHKGYHTITCGTAYDTLFWSSLIDTIPPAVWNMEIPALCMTFLGEMERRTYNYNTLFYLPWDASQHDEPARNWEMVRNAKLPEIAEGMGRYFIELTGTPRQKTTHALDIARHIRSISDPLPTEDDQPSV
jgi:hypothetical protein